MKNIKGVLPNLLTFMNMSLGVIAILFAVNSEDTVELLIPASLLIIMAALTDRFDGKVARMLDATSELGRELDSLSDLVSLGLAPTIITWKISFISLGIPGYILALIFPIAGAFRLARYNISSFDNVFRGMPITIAGSLLTLDNIFNCFAQMHGTYNPRFHLLITVILVILLSYLMISQIKIKKV